MFKHIIYSLLLFAAAAAFLGSCRQPDHGLHAIDYVNPMIGTGGIGHTFPGATIPFGMIQLSPSNDFKDWNWCSGYHYSDSILKGFAHNHISGPGLAGLGDILFMPGSGKVLTEPGSEEDPDSGYRSRFSHDHETALPGYYAVHLDDYNIDVELTCTARVGFHRYTFLNKGPAYIIIDPTHRIMESLYETEIEYVGDSEIRGYKYSDGEAGLRKVYFHAVFSEPFSSKGIIADGRAAGSEKARSVETKAYVVYDCDSVLVVSVKVGLSFVSYQGAKLNLETEADGLEFYEAREKAYETWNNVLKRIEVKSDNEDYLKNFYTAVYHAFQSPNIISDTDGKYFVEGKIYNSDIPQYSRYSTWDTYRALHPLFTLIEHSRNAEFVNSLASRHSQAGVELPVWELCGHDNVCMLGYSPASVMAEAIVKDLPGIDIEKAYNAMRAAAFNADKVSPNSGVSGIDEYIQTGFVPAEIKQSVSKTTEYGYHDWAIAMVARKLGRTEDYKLFRNRSYGFKRLFNSEKSYIWPMSGTGEWEDIDMTVWDELITHYISGNIWGYSSYAPHAMPELIKLYGGHSSYAEWLDGVVSDSSEIGGSQHVDISGFIGKYGHGDEPSHQMAYLYNYAGQPWKTQELVSRVLETMYKPTVDGLVNNDDLGQMSAWYIFSSLGFYPVSPVDEEYIIGAPLFDKAQIRLSNGNSFVVLAANQSARNKYIKWVKLNGTKLKSSYITHDEIMKGGILEFRMSAKPNKSWAVKTENLPGFSNFDPGELGGATATFTPFERDRSNVSEGQRVIILESNNRNSEIHYTLDGSSPDTGAAVFDNKIIINSSGTLRARAYSEGLKPGIEFSKEYYITDSLYLEPGYPILLMETEPKGYGEGRPGLILDRELGSEDFGDGKWIAFDGSDMVAIIDFGKPVNLNNIMVGCLTGTISWIFPPSGIELSVSDNNKDYSKVAKKDLEVLTEHTGPLVGRYKISFKPQYNRYLKIHLLNYGPMPYWHGAAGKKPWVFVDEILINTK